VIPALAHLPAAVEQVCALLGSLPDTSTPTTDGTWTVGDTAAHMIGGARTYAAYSRGEPSVTVTSDEMNAARLAAVPTREGPALAQLLAEAEGDYVRATEGLAPTDEVNWHFGLRILADTSAGIRLVEHLVHGFDMARAVGRPWHVPDEAGAAGFAAVSPLFAFWVKGTPEPAATVAFRPAGGDELVAVLGGNGLTYDSTAAPAARVEGPGGGVLLLVYGRASVDDLGLQVSGDRGALDRWLDCVKAP
jgi:uncharacterized protein (TIGR03083 family)